MRPLSSLLGTALAVLLAASPALAQPVVDGDLSDADYVTIGTKPNSNAGFGGAIDTQSIRYYSDTDNGVLYLAVEGKLNTGATDGIGLLLGFSELDGTDAGSDLTAGGGGHFLGQTGRPFQADFDVDFGFAINPGVSALNVFVDAKRYGMTTQTGYLGSFAQNGTSGTNLAGAGFTAGAVTIAFNNAGTAGLGLEMAIPFSELGITAPDETSTLEAFAFVVSSTAYFSNVAVGGDITGGNPGFQPDFSTNARFPGGFGSPDNGPIGTAPFHTTAAPLGPAGPPAPTAFTFVRPTATSSYRAGGFLKPIWTTTPTGGAGDVTVTLRKGGTDVATIYTGPNLAQPDFTNARYAIPVGTPAAADYTIYVELDADPLVNAESQLFTITSPPVVVTAPTAGEIFATGDETTVTFTTSGIGSPITARVYLRRTGAAGSTLLATERNTDGSVDIPIPFDAVEAADYFILVRATDGTTTATGKSGLFEIQGVDQTRTAPATSHYVVAAEASTREAYLLVDTDGLAGEIGVFAGDVLVGAARIGGATTEVVVFGADLEDGDALSVRHFDGVETTLAATAFADGEEIAITKGAAAGAAVTLRVAPNPTAGTAVVRVSAPAEVSVYDVLGRRVADLGAVETEARWDASGASPGVYVVRATSASGVESVRVTVSR